MKITQTETWQGDHTICAGSAKQKVEIRKDKRISTTAAIVFFVQTNPTSVTTPMAQRGGHTFPASQFTVMCMFFSPAVVM